MKLYSSVGPNPKVVRMFLAEKGVEVPKEDVDIQAGANRQPEFLHKNPLGGLPVLELDNGLCLSEILAICEYLEEKHPAPALIGTTPEERAETRMWTRRIDLNICEPMATGFRSAEGLKMFKDRMRCLPQAADDLKAIAQDNLVKLDQQMIGKAWVCGERFSVADILLYAFLNFFAKVGQPMDDKLTNIAAWYERARARPSAKA